MSWLDDLVDFFISIEQAKIGVESAVYNELSSAFGYTVACAKDTLGKLQIDLAGAPQAVTTYFTKLINSGWVYGGTFQVPIVGASGTSLFSPSLGIIVPYYGSLQQLKDDMPNLVSGQKIAIREELLKELGYDFTTVKTGDNVPVGSGGSWVELILGIVGSVGCGIISLFTLEITAPLCIAGVWGAVVIAEVTKQPDAAVVSETDQYQIVKTADNRTVKIDKTTGETTEIGSATGTPLSTIFEAVKWAIIAVVIVVCILLLVKFFPRGEK